MATPVDTPLPISAGAVIGVWLNDPQWPITERVVLRPLSRWTFRDDGTVVHFGQAFHVVDGEAREPFGVAEHVGTWRVEGAKIVAELPTWKLSRWEFTLIRRRESNGETRIFLTPKGGGYWRASLSAAP